MALKMHSQYMDPEDMEKIRQMANDKNISLAQAVRDAIRLYLKRKGK